MQNWSKSIPEGTRDILFQDCAVKIEIENKLRGLYKKTGYMEIITPTLEYYDVFNIGNQGVEQESMYKLLDNSGRILVLRPDITMPVARVAGTKLKGNYYPLRFCYSMNVFRTNENLNGKKNEFTQCGVEIIGVENFRADVEVLTTAIKAMLEIGIDNFKVELGQVQFFKGIAEEIKMSSADIEKIRGFIENKNFAALKDFLDNNEYELDGKTINALNSLPRLFGGIEVINKARTLTNNAKAIEALDSIETIYKILEKMELNQYFSVDLGMVHHIDYYTGPIFRAYVAGYGNDVLFGGRYDSLIEQFGINIPATGFAINVDSIVEVMVKSNKNELDLSADYLIYYDVELMGQANILADQIRRSGLVCELALLKSKEENIEYAEKRKIKSMIMIESNKDIVIYDVQKKVTKLWNWGI